MKLPDNLSEEEFLKVLEYILDSFPKTLSAGYYDYEDVKQHLRMECWKIIHKWDGKRPLENFLRINIRNRLYNLYRDATKKLKLPCKKCPHYDPNYINSKNQCLAFENKSNCKPYEKYERQSNTKNSIVAPVDLVQITGTPITKEDSTHQDAEYAILEKELDRRIPAEYRADYLKIRSGIPVPTQRRNEIKRIVAEIIGLASKEMEEKD